MKDFVKKWVDEQVFSKKVIIELKGKWFLASARVKELYTEDSFPGLFLGQLGKGAKFIPSLALLSLLAPFVKKRVIVNSKSAWLFICGRDVLTQGLISKPGRGEVFVFDEDKNFLGLGSFDGFIVKNIFDLGDYIRREK